MRSAVTATPVPAIRLGAQRTQRLHGESVIARDAYRKIVDGIHGRIERALDLTVTRLDEYQYLVQGGREPHYVDLDGIAKLLWDNSPVRESGDA